MDKEQFLRNIQEEDNNSLRTGAANRILQLLQRQRYNNNEDSVKRWIWELCQNAKDVCNDSGKVKIRIDLDESNKRVIFRHNGRAFSLANVMSLINQSSSKDRDDETERTSGKFGTGFLTTHLLSEIVNISGILETEPENYSRFRISLDRTGHDKKEIIAALEKAVSQLQECQSMLVSDYDKYAYNTIFEYELDEDGIEVAQQGIENLRVSAPFVLSMLSDIEEITLEATGENYKYSRQYNCGLANSLVHEIIYVSSTETKKISSPEKLEELIGKSQEQCTEVSDDRIELTEEVLLQLGIDSEDALEKAFSYPDFASKYIRNSKHDAGTYEYLQTILERSKNNILLHLNSKEEYDITEMRQIANTIFIIKKDGKEIFLLARPSDGGEVRIYYETEKDLLDYTMDWELWVEDGKSEPQKITFGKMIKLTGLNRIPLRGI